MTTESDTRSLDQKEAEQTTIESNMTSSPATLTTKNDPSTYAATKKPQQSENVDSDASGDSDLEEEKIDESQLTPRQLETLRQARREKIAAKKAAKRAKKKKRKQAAKGGGGANAANDGEDEQQRNAKQPKTSPQSSPASSPTPSSFTTITATLTKSAADTPAATFGVASILQHKALRDTVAIDQSKPLISGGGANLTSPSPSPPVASSQTSTSTAASSTTPAFGMTLDEWRALSTERRELSMTVIGEDVTAAKLAEKRAAIEANRLTGLGGGYKDTTGWICQSYNCTRFENYKNDTVCKRCGAHRRY